MGMVTRRLFVFFLALVLFVSGIYALSDADIRALKITAHGDSFFVGQEVTYTLTLAGVDPSLTYAELPDFSVAGARFVSSKKEELYDLNGSGTRFSFQIAFTAAGVADLPPLTVYISRRAYTVPFARVTVYEDPATVVPQIFVVFDDVRWQQAAVSQPIAVEVGEPIGFTLYAQYCRQLLHVSWELPKNALFTETERFSLARGEVQQTAFSPDRVPVAHFVWTPLVAGMYDFPSFAIEAVAYNGTRKNPAVPAYQIVVHTETDTSASDRASGATDFSANDTQRGTLFADAFQPTQTEIASAQTQTGLAQDTADSATQTANNVSAQSATNFSVLNAPLPFAVSLSRHKKLPRSLLAAAVASVLVACACVLVHHRRALLVPIALAFVFLLASVVAGVYTSRRYAVFAGGSLRSVPEAAVQTVSTLPAGTYVRILEQAGDWVYIENDGMTGWIRRADAQEID